MSNFCELNKMHPLPTSRTLQANIPHTNSSPNWTHPCNTATSLNQTISQRSLRHCHSTFQFQVQLQLPAMDGHQTISCRGRTFSLAILTTMKNFKQPGWMDASNCQLGADILQHWRLSPFVLANSPPCTSAQLHIHRKKALALCANMIEDKEACSSVGFWSL